MFSHQDTGLIMVQNKRKPQSRRLSGMESRGLTYCILVSSNVSLFETTLAQFLTLMRRLTSIPKHPKTIGGER